MILYHIAPQNRPLALRGHVANASFKQWVGILLMPKIVTAHKNYFTPEIWEETHLREILNISVWFFRKVVWFVLATMLEGMLLPSNTAAKTTSCLYLVQRFLVTLRCAVNVITSSFQHFPWSLSAKFVFREVIHYFKNHILVMLPAANLLIFLRKWCGFEKPNHYYFV